MPATYETEEIEKVKAAWIAAVRAGDVGRLLRPVAVRPAVPFRTIMDW